MLVCYFAIGSKFDRKGRDGTLAAGCARLSSSAGMVGNVDCSPQGLTTNHADTVCNICLP